MRSLVDKKCLKSLEYFQRFGVNSEELLIINDIYNATPENWKDASSSDKFQQVDIKTFNIFLNIFNQKIAFRDIQSKKIYEYLIQDLQNLYTLEVKDGQCNLFLRDKRNIK